MKFIKKNWSTLVVVAVCIVLELLIANYMSIKLFISGAEEVRLDINSGEVFESQEDVKKNEDGIYLMNGKLVFEDLSVEMHNISIVMNGNGEYADIYIQYSDENYSSNESLFGTNSNRVRAYADKGLENYFSFDSFGKISRLQIFPEKSTYIPITSITINYRPPFHFNIIRALLMIIVGLVITTGAWKTIFDSKKHSKYIAVTATLLCIVVIGLSVITALKCESASMFDDDPNTSLEQYGQQFQAFLNGRLNLDINYDTSALEKVENPYDNTQRVAAGAYALETWDHAYYNGNFYSYFGVAPIITVYLPFYLIFGHIPSALIASSVLCAYAIIFISLLYNLIVKKLCGNVPVLAVVIGQVSLLFTSLIFVLMAETKFYYMAEISGLTWFAAFFYFLLSAYYSDKFKHRVPLLILSGISLVMTVASRPSLLIYALAAIVPAFFVLSDKSETLKHKLCYVTSIVTPVIIGAAAIMIYNYARFDNPFEFGFSYQLTVCDPAVNTIAISALPVTIYHYFLQPFGFTSEFPHLKFNFLYFEHYSKYIYIAEQNAGILNYPLIWGSFFLPTVVNKKDKFKKYFLITLTCTALLMTFIDTCKAGVHYRYTADILLPLGIVAIIVFFNLLSSLHATSSKHFIFAYTVIIICLVVSAIFGFLLIFANEYQNMITLYPSVTRALQNILA